MDHVDIVGLLVERGDAFSDEQTMDGFTPLHLASQKGHLNVINRLFELGASINEKDNDGWTPLRMACAGGHLNIVILLLRRKALTTEDYRHCMLSRHRSDSGCSYSQRP